MSPISGLRQTNTEVSTRNARIGASIGWISTAAWMAIGMDSIVRPIQDNRRDVFWWLPFGLLVLTIVAVHRVQPSPGLPMERYTHHTLMGASALALLGNLGVMLNNSFLATMGFPGGAIVFAIGLIAFGIATWRARVFPRYVAVALMLWEPGSIATGLLLAPISPLHDRGAYSAGVWKGLAIAMIAAGLQSISQTHRKCQGGGADAARMLSFCDRNKIRFLTPVTGNGYLIDTKDGLPTNHPVSLNAPAPKSKCRVAARHTCRMHKTVCRRSKGCNSQC